AEVFPVFVPGLFVGVAVWFEGCAPFPRVGDWLGAPPAVPLGAWPGTAPFCAVGVAVDVGQGTAGVLGFTGCAGPVGVGAGLLGVGGAWVAPGPAAFVVIGVGGPIVEAGGVICPEAPVVVGGGGGAVGRAWAT